MLGAANPKAGATRIVEVRPESHLNTDDQARLIKLLATGLAWRLKAHPSSLTSSPNVCRHSDHGDDDEALGD